ncbi:hypothetical protein [Thiofilum flexile]|uniref:hypothetical protein n=1 Tax=Thiofilum flexile TaxID=125627 RepID=UPI00035C8383|nr:hypothetical protein [Thiofilum flexile]
MLENLFSAEKSGRLPQVDLVFRVPDVKSLQFDESFDPLTTWHYFTHHIRRYPHDLRAHTQRVLLATRPVLHSKLAGTLQDLFIALGTSGQALREELLEVAQPYLSNIDNAYFESWLKTPVLDSPWREGSILVSGNTTKPKVLVQLQKTTTIQQYASVLEEVYDCLEYGQVERARELLEAECLRPAHDPIFDQELLNIYQYTRDQGRLNQMINTMQKMGFIVPDSWFDKRQEAVQW